MQSTRKVNTQHISNTAFYASDTNKTAETDCKIRQKKCRQITLILFYCKQLTNGERCGIITCVRKTERQKITIFEA